MICRCGQRSVSQATKPRPVFGTAPPDREEPVLDGFFGLAMVTADLLGDAQRVLRVAAVKLGEGEDVIALGTDHQLLVRHRARFSSHPFTNVARG